jgi:hypothetical protein
MKTIKKARLGLERETLVELRRDDLRDVAGGVEQATTTMPTEQTSKFTCERSLCARG